MTKILVTFGTREFRFRQTLLVASALANRVVDRSEKWTVQRLVNTGFFRDNPQFSFHERGAGFWAWKPYVILNALHSSSLGDLVIYADVGRHDVRLMRVPTTTLERWMDEHHQDCFPGVDIPWHGPMSQWTKADTFKLLECESATFKSAAPIQASFSVWRNTERSKSFVQQWYQGCQDRRMVTDDQNACGTANEVNFVEHRHDQSILSLLCRKNGLQGLRYPHAHPPSFEDRSIEPWLLELGEPAPVGIINHGFRVAATAYGHIEKLLR